MAEGRTGRAATRPDHPDPRLRGRRYAIAFEQVWQASLKLAGGGLGGWSLSAADDYSGQIRAEAKTPLLGSTGTVEIRIHLDEDAQTRVDMVAAAGTGWTIPGAAARRIRKFLNRLDDEVGADPRTLLSPEEGYSA